MWMWGPVAWGFWWIFPLIGLAMCIGMMLLMTRVAGRGHGCMGMFGHGRMSEDELTDARREINALRDEIRQLKSSR